MSERASTKGRDDELASASYPQETPRVAPLLKDGDVVERLKQFRMRWQESGDLTYLGKALVDAVVEIERLRKALDAKDLDLAGTWKAILHVFGPAGVPKVGEFFPEARQYVENVRAKSALEDCDQGRADANPKNPLSEGRERS